MVVWFIQRQKSWTWSVKMWCSVLFIFLTPFKLYSLWAAPLCVITLCVSLFLLKCFGAGGPQGRECIVEQTVFSYRCSFFLYIWSVRKGEKNAHGHTLIRTLYKREKCVAICLGYLEHFSILGWIFFPPCAVGKKLFLHLRDVFLFCYKNLF